MSVHRRSRLPLLLILLIFPGLGAAGRSDLLDLDAVVRTGLKSITAGKARKHVVYLAGPKCEGRASGEPGCDAAAEYLEEAFRVFGLTPGGDDGSFRQVFSVNAGPFPGQHPKVKRPTGPHPTANLVAVLEGADPELSRETIVLGAHYDHIGPVDPRKLKVYWGADDNASGTAGVLLVAEAFAKATLRPRRTIVFVLFSGEERGLLGSRHYVSRPARPLRDTVAMLNFDMLGRNEPSRMDVYGSESSPELSEANLSLMKEAKFRFELKGGSVFQRSDHYTFYKRNIPVLFFNSGMHGDLHGLGDEPKKLNYRKIERAAEHVWRLLWEIGNRDVRPTFHEIPPSGAAGIFGFLPDQMSREEIKALRLGKKRGGVRVRRVEPGGAGERAGLLAADVIYALAGQTLGLDDPLGDLDRIADRLRKGGSYALSVLRAGRPKKLKVVCPK